MHFNSCPRGESELCDTSSLAIATFVSVCAQVIRLLIVQRTQR
jgi:hypothetical protein